MQHYNSFTRYRNFCYLTPSSIFKKLNTIFIFTLFLLTLSANAWSAESNLFHYPDSLSAPLKKVTIDVVVGLTKPPYVIQEQDSGFELDLIRATLATIELQPRFIYVPLGRSLKLLDQGMGDALMTINEHIVPNNTIRTMPYITYQNVAISLSEAQITLDNISHISQRKVAAFQHAHKYLGKDYARVIKKNPDYIELPNQFQQVKLLLEKRVDVVIMDINIFHHIFKQVSENFGSPPEITIHHIFPMSPYSLAFKDPSLVPIFNDAFVSFKESNEYQFLLDKYQIQL